MSSSSSSSSYIATAIKEPSVDSSNSESSIEFTPDKGKLNQNDGKPIFYRSPLFWVGCVGMIIAGSTNALFAKANYLQTSYPCSPHDDCEPQVFDGFMLLAILKYIWLFFVSGFFYFIVDTIILVGRGKEPKFSTREEMSLGKQLPRSLYIKLIGTSLIDTTFTVTVSCANMFTTASMVSVIGMLQILSAAIADMVLLRRSLTVGRIIGLMVIVMGICLYGWGSSLLDEDGSQAPRPIMGASLAAISAICRGIHSSIQGRLMRNYSLPPVKLVLIESMYGIVIISIYIVVFHFTGVIDFAADFWMAIRSWQIMLYANICCAESFLWNGGGAIVGKFVSGLFRMILARAITFMLWTNELLLGWSLFSWITFFGWIIMLGGVVLYAFGLHPMFIGKADWFIKPVLCCRCLKAPEMYIKQKEADTESTSDEDDEQDTNTV